MKSQALKERKNQRQLEKENFNLGKPLAVNPVEGQFGILINQFLFESLFHLYFHLVHLMLFSLDYILNKFLYIHF